MHALRHPDTHTNTHTHTHTNIQTVVRQGETHTLLPDTNTRNGHYT